MRHFHRLPGNEKGHGVGAGEDAPAGGIQCVWLIQITDYRFVLPYSRKMKFMRMPQTSIMSPSFNRTGPWMGDPLTTGIFAPVPR